jgi:hypothetical protein
MFFLAIDRFLEGCDLLELGGGHNEFFKVELYNNP